MRADGRAPEWLAQRIIKAAGKVVDAGVPWLQVTNEVAGLANLRVRAAIPDDMLAWAWPQMVSAGQSGSLVAYHRVIDDICAMLPPEVSGGVVGSCPTAATMSALVAAVAEYPWVGSPPSVASAPLDLLAAKARAAGRPGLESDLASAIAACVPLGPGEVVAGPQCGDGEGLLAILDRALAGSASWSVADRRFLRDQAVVGSESDPSLARIARQRLMLHGSGTPGRSPLVGRADLQPQSADVVVSCPPVGRRFGASSSRIPRTDLWVVSSDPAVQAVAEAVALLRPGGRAAVVVPDSFLFSRGPAEALRSRLLRQCDVHTIWRLPVGVLGSAQASVVFFDRLTVDDGSTIVHDLRDVGRVGGRGQLRTADVLAKMVDAFHTPAMQPGESRIRHAELLAMPDCSWDVVRPQLPVVGDPATLAAAVAGDLRTALDAMSVLERLSAPPAE